LTIREKEEKIDVCETKIEQLEKFAVGVGNLQKVIALETDLGKKLKILDNGLYAKDEDVQEWNNFTDRFLKENDIVPYIKILRDSIKAYRDNILSRSYSNRFLSIISEFPPNFAFATKYGGTYYKIHIPYHIKWMQVNNTSSIDQFKQKSGKDVCGFRTSEYVTSYIENDCLQVFFNNQLRQNYILKTTFPMFILTNDFPFHMKT